MKASATRSPWCRWAVCLAAVWFVAGATVAAEIPGMIKKRGSGEWLKGTIRYKAATKKYVLKRGPVTIEIRLDEVDDIRVKKPADLDAAVDKVRSKQYGAALGVLEKVMRDYEGLTWDVEAARWLAEAYLNTGKAGQAVALCDKVSSSGSQMSAAMADVYLRALEASGNTTKLRSILSRLIETGGRPVAAVAQLKRGDIDKDKGDFKDALLDGYLRTVVLYADVKSVQPEALFKASVCFKELGQHSYAEKMRKELLKKYPTSSYAGQVR